MIPLLHGSNCFDMWYLCQYVNVRTCTVCTQSHPVASRAAHVLLRRAAEDCITEVFAAANDPPLSGLTDEAQLQAFRSAARYAT